MRRCFSVPCLSCYFAIGTILQKAMRISQCVIVAKATANSLQQSTLPVERDTYSHIHVLRKQVHVINLMPAVEVVHKIEKHTAEIVIPMMRMLHMRPMIHVPDMTLMVHMIHSIQMVYIIQRACCQAHHP